MPLAASTGSPTSSKPPWHARSRTYERPPHRHPPAQPATRDQAPQPTHPGNTATRDQATQPTHPGSTDHATRQHNPRDPLQWQKQGFPPADTQAWVIRPAWAERWKERAAPANAAGCIDRPAQAGRKDDTPTPPSTPPQARARSTLRMPKSHPAAQARHITARHATHPVHTTPQPSTATISAQPPQPGKAKRTRAGHPSLRNTPFSA